MPKPNEIVELPTFTRAANAVLSDDEIEKLKEHLAYEPEAGDLISGTGGARKIRWRAQGKGKRGGGRVIYFFHSPRMPLLLMDFYAKSEKQDVSDKEKKDLRDVIEAFVEQYS